LRALFRGHEHVGVFARNKAQERTVGGVPGDNGPSAGLAALKGISPVIEAVSALLFLGTVAGDAVLLEDREEIFREVDLGGLISVNDNGERAEAQTEG
jgi:hypothetical protein